MVEYDNLPWGALVVLALNPKQSDVPLWGFIWRLCVYYMDINTITTPFKFPFRQFKDIVLNFVKSIHRIMLDVDLGYFHILFHPSSRTKLAFFGFNWNITLKIYTYGSPVRIPSVFGYDVGYPGLLTRIITQKENPQQWVGINHGWNSVIFASADLPPQLPRSDIIIDDSLTLHAQYK